MDRDLFRTLTFGEIIRETFRLYGDVLAPVVMLAMVAHIPFLFFAQIVMENGQPDAAAAFALLVAILVLTGVVVTAIYLVFISSIVGRPIGLGTAVRLALQRIAVTVLLAYMITQLASHLGLILFVLPGLVLGGLFAATVPVVMIERRGALAAIGRSIALVRQDWFKGIGVFAFGTFLSELLPMQILFVMQATVGHGPFSPMLAAVLGAVVMPLASGANLLLYFALRSAEQQAAAAALRTDLLKVIPAEN